MLRRGLMLAVAVSVGATARIAAQQAGTIEFGLFGSYTVFSDQIVLDDAFGAGGRAGYFASPVLSVELDGAYTTTNVGVTSVSYLPFHLRGLLDLPFTERFTAFLGTGLAVERFGNGRGTGAGAGSIAGIRVALSSSVALRADATWDWIFSPPDGEEKYANFGTQAGLSVLLGNRGSAPGDDGDGDGVMNRADACPGTAPGSDVDDRGCPVPGDGDKDGVTDVKDICPGSPAGARVDANGCSGREPKGSAVSP